MKTNNFKAWFGPDLEKMRNTLSATVEDCGIDEDSITLYRTIQKNYFINVTMTTSY